MKASIRAKVTPVATAVVALILALVPFHAFLTVWGASAAGHYDALRLWKELLLLVLVGMASWLLWRDKKLWQMVKHSWLFLLIAAYVALYVLLGVVAFARHQVNITALGYGLVVNLRPVVFFVAVWIVASQSGWLRAQWQKLVLVPAAIVAIFGLLQAWVLPADFLRHFGYDVGTIKPYETVDQKLQYLRVQSTLRGANPLGAYLIPIVSVAAAWLVRQRHSKKICAVAAVFGLAAVAVLYNTYSRSAYIGAVLALVTLGWLLVRGRRAKVWLAAAVAAFVLVGGGATWALRHNDQFENTFFHTDEHSRSATSSNEQRSSALQSGVHDVLHQPLGDGPGTAGPASTHNNHPARIAENYYLQLGQEVGWLGLILFLLINALLALQLWQRHAELLPCVMLASLVGISFVNMLSHAWTDDTLAYVWWGLAAIATAPAILQTKAERPHGKTKK